uniref:Uncharacterized protein n=1 Tax=Oryza punctata TaxID=4537 RepID=A0A0E0L0C9_ORYPU
MAVKGLLIWPLSTYTSAEQVTRARLDDYKKHLQAAKEEVKRKDLEWGVLTEALKQAKAEANALKLANDKLKKDQDAMVDYYNHSEVKVKALREEVDEAKVIDSSKGVSYVLYLALADLGVSANDVPTEGAFALDFTEWSQQAGRAIADIAGIYGDCCAWMATNVVLSVLREHGCKHVYVL